MISTKVGAHYPNASTILDLPDGPDTEIDTFVPEVRADVDPSGQSPIAIGGRAVTETPTEPGPRHVLNPKEPPRILVLVRDETVRERLQFLNSRPGTYKWVESLAEVDPEEWDAVITDIALAENRTPPTSSARPVFSMIAPGYGKERNNRNFPDQMFVFALLRPGGATFSNVLDWIPDKAGNDRWLRMRTDIPGDIVRSSSATMTEGMTDLVKTSLLPAAHARGTQFGVRLDVPSEAHRYPAITPFAFGPGDVILAGTYRRVDGASVWLVPVDVEDFAPWWDEALRDWHNLAPAKFPDMPSWSEDYEWLPYEEQVTVDRMRDARTEFERQAEEHEARMTNLAAQLDAAAASNESLRQLLVGTGIPLQNAVSNVLRAFGYNVRDMDEVYPERQGREDYRITEQGHDDWLVIGDATGVTKGAKQEKLTNLANYVVAYYEEEGTRIHPRQWLLVNRQLEQMPTNRSSSIFRPDVRSPFEKARGLAIDTPALYVLYRANQAGTVTGQQIRDLLRDRAGELTTQQAMQWLDTFST